jgi:hypothetical protein
MLLRIGRRREAFATRDVAEVIATEFHLPDGSDDLSPSVYEISDASRVVQCHAEHAASASLDPKGGTHADLEGLLDVPPTPVVEGRFGYTSSVHREIRLASATALTELVGRLVADLPQRLHVTTKDELRSYVTACMAAGDPEWTTFLAQSSKASKWRQTRVE